MLLSFVRLMAIGPEAAGGLFAVEGNVVDDHGAAVLHGLGDLHRGVPGAFTAAHAVVGRHGGEADVEIGLRCDVAGRIMPVLRGDGATDAVD